MSDEQVKVIPIGEVHRPVLTRKIAKTGLCSHDNVELNEKTRMCECKHCGSVVEPFDWLWNQCIREENGLRQLAQLKKDIEKLQQRRKQLSNPNKN
jgi:hypothetical protein